MKKDSLTPDKVMKKDGTHESILIRDEKKEKNFEIRDESLEVHTKDDDDTAEYAKKHDDEDEVDEFSDHSYATKFGHSCSGDLSVKISNLSDGNYSFVVGVTDFDGNMYYQESRESLTNKSNSVVIEVLKDSSQSVLIKKAL